MRYSNNCMDKKYAVAAIATMIFVTGYTIYSDLWLFNSQGNNPVNGTVTASESIATPVDEQDSELRDNSNKQRSVVILDKGEFLTFEYQLPIGKKWLVNQSGSQPSFWQAFLVDESINSLEDTFKSDISVYIEKLIGEDGLQRCHKYLCEAEVVSKISLPSGWEYLGSTNYGDAGHTFSSPHTYRYISQVNNFAVYVESNEELHLNGKQELNDAFKSFRFIAN